MNLSWYALNRQELPNVLMGELKLSSRPMSDPYSTDSEVVLGISNAERGSDPIVAVALVGATGKELFSWVSTYAEEIFPLTQFCRVCSIDDWKQLQLQTHNESMIGAVSSIWPSVVLGEMLGQADADTNVAGIPLARAAACFSFAIARTILLYPSHEIALNRCTERMAMVERDSRFGQRLITVESLKKVCSVALPLQDVLNESLNIVDIVLQIVRAIDKQAADLLVANNSLLSDSAEDRVEGFDSVADTLFEKLNSNAIKRDVGTVTLAAAAILAGRGTSHIQLLATVAKRFPETLVWYGLLAGVLGPRGWDKAWRQQTKSVERSLRQFFRPDEPVAADICWSEYEWLSKTYNSMEVLNSIPKSAPRSLAIELLPGVSCQFRFAGQGSNAKTIEDHQATEIKGKIEVPVITESILLQAVDLLADVQKLLLPHGVPRGHRQLSLFEGDSSTKPSPPPRRKPKDKL